MASCEADIDCAITMLLFSVLSEGKSPWTEDFVNIIEDRNAILFWHCGNAPYNISDGRPLMEVVYEGPALTSSSVKGVATICRLNHFRGSFEIYAGLGEVLKSAPILRGSNMLIDMQGGNMEYIKFLLNNGVPHHNVIVYGDLISELEEFGNIIGIPVIVHK